MAACTLSRCGTETSRGGRHDAVDLAELLGEVVDEVRGLATAKSRDRGHHTPSSAPWTRRPG